MRRTCSGVARARIDASSTLIPLDLPAPVWPAIRTWGKVARLARVGRPAMSRPRATVRGLFSLWASALHSTSPTRTVWRLAFGTSTPMADLPGIGAWIRTSGAAMA